MRKHICIVLFVAQFGLSQNIDSTNCDSALIADSIKMLDSEKNLVIYGNDDEIRNSGFKAFLRDYDILIGALLGSFLAALIAIYSVWRTNKNNLQLETDRLNTQRQIRENVYCGTLFAIFSELIAHDKIHKNILSDIEKFMSYFSASLNIPTDEVFNEFPLEYLKYCRIKILDYEKYETKTLSSLSHYINVVEMVQLDLNLKRIKEVTQLIADKKNLISGVSDYFQHIINTLNRLKEVRDSLQKDIPDILQSFPQSELAIDKQQELNDNTPN